MCEKGSFARNLPRADDAKKKYEKRIMQRMDILYDEIHKFFL